MTVNEVELHVSAWVVLTNMTISKTASCRRMHKYDIPYIKFKHKPNLYVMYIYM